MRANAFLIVNGVIVFFLLVLIFRGRRRDKPTPLTIHDRGKLSDFSRPKPRRTQFGTGGGRERVLTFMFIHDGKQYDLFGALNLPAGSPQHACMLALNLLKTRPNRDEKFIQAIERALAQAFPIS